MDRLFQTAVIASGSSGNCVLVRSATTKLLIDAGVSMARILKALASLQLDAQKIEAIVISHEHSDHITSVGALCRKFQIPVYLTAPTYGQISQKLGRLPRGHIHFEPGKEFIIGDIIIRPFFSPHDSIDCSNFVFSCLQVPDRKLGLATDLGYASRILTRQFKDVTTVILESNHDLKMLMQGPYPWSLKQRIKGAEGHLSNEQAAAVISQIAHPALKNIILAHLSEQNNNPQLALKNMSDFLQSIRLEANLHVALQETTSPLFDV